VNDGKYHDGKSSFTTITLFVPINKVYLLTAHCYIHDHFLTCSGHFNAVRNVRIIVPEMIFAIIKIDAGDEIGRVF